MKVREAVEQLADMEQDAELLICAHGFKGLEGRAWTVSAFEPTDDKSIVLIEGAGETRPEDQN